MNTEQSSRHPRTRPPLSARTSHYFISVHASTEEDTSQNSMVYTISAVTSTRDSNECRALIDAMPQMAIIHGDDGHGAVRYYSFKSATDAKSVRFTVQVAQGKISVLISNNGQEPSQENYQYAFEDVDDSTTRIPRRRLSSRLTARH